MGRRMKFLTPVVWADTEDSHKQEAENRYNYLYWLLGKYTDKPSNNYINNVKEELNVLSEILGKVNEV